MKIIVLYIVLFLTSCPSFAQSASSNEEVKLAVEKLFKAMEEKDSLTLQSLLSDDLSYGHSSGLIQDKKAFMEEVISSKPLHLKNIQGKEQRISIVSETAIVRHIFIADGVPQNGEQVSIRIGNCLVWTKNEGKWKLLVRQAFKLN